MTDAPPKISLCLIMCDEEKALARCLKNAAGAFDELVIVDTGSRDQSVAVAAAHGAIIVHHAWQDDFSAARNAGLELATGDWILILDPDEVLSPRDVAALRKLTLTGDADAFQIPTRNYTNNSYLVGFVPNPRDYPEGEGFRGFVESTKVRLFRNHLGLRFVGVIHELVDLDVDAKGFHGFKASFPIHHWPDTEPAKIGSKKSFFYLRVAEKKAQLEPENPKAVWELAIAQYVNGSRVMALRTMIHAISMAEPDAEKLFTIGSVLQGCGYKETARLMIEKAVCKQYPALTHANEDFKRFPDLCF
jgi:glycosyltransferase involved in cell wall biosynthesis